VSVYFFDSSALVKLYAREIGSAWVKAVADISAGNQIYIANITEVEVASAVSRRLRENQITPTDARETIAKLREDFEQNYNIFELGGALIAKAVLLVQAYPLRGYDAVQLATALLVNEERNYLNLPSLIFICADVSLSNAAQAQGLTVDDPNLHP